MNPAVICYIYKGEYLIFPSTGNLAGLFRAGENVWSVGREPRGGTWERRGLRAGQCSLNTRVQTCSGHGWMIMNLGIKAQVGFLGETTLKRDLMAFYLLSHAKGT